MASDEDDIADFLGSSTPLPWWRRRKVWIPAAIVLALLIILMIYRHGENRTEYITQDVATRSLDLTVTATGNLRPTNQVQVGSEVSGRIDAVNVDVNDHVHRGEVLARINTDVIDDAITRGRADLEAARAAVAQAQATLDVDKAQLDRLNEVHRLSGGRVPSKAEMETAEGTVKRDQAVLASSQANVVSAQASLSSAQTNRDRAVIRSPVSGVVLARQVEPGQTVAASFNTPTLFVLAEDLSTMQLRVNVDEADVGQVKAGQQATFTVDAYPGRQFPARVERVDLASNTTAQASSGSGSGGSSGSSSNAVVDYEARLTVDNRSGLLRPGMTATATIATEKTPSQLVVPNAALRFEPPKKDEGSSIEVGPRNMGLKRGEQQATIGANSQQTVYVLQPDNSLKQMEVTTWLSDGRYTLVRSSELKAGMKVVTAIKAKDE